MALRKNSCVVPYIGTWIETYDYRLSDFDFDVVPYIGTWIETIKVKETGTAEQSYLI